MRCARSLRAHACGPLLVACFTFSGAQAATITVGLDGQADYTNIADAIPAASAGDTVLVLPGTYPPTSAVTVNVAITLMSSGGPAVTTLLGSHFRILAVSASGVAIRGLRFANTSFQEAIFVQGADVDIRDCHFENNVGGGIWLRFAQSSFIQDCLFAGNRGTAVMGDFDAEFIVDRCVFRENTRCILGYDIDITNSVFYWNHAIDASGVLGVLGVGLVSGNTVVRNYSHPHPGSRMFAVRGNVLATIAHNIIADNEDLYGIWPDGGSHSCNVLWMNTSGDVFGGVPGPDEAVADPLFCDPARGNFTLASASPALAANNSCGAIGAFAQGCDAPTPPLFKVWTLRDDGTGDFDSMHDALAACVPGDTIEVGPGTYAFGAEFRKSVHVRSTDGPDVTVFDGEGAHSIVTVDLGIQVVFEGLTFTRGRGYMGGAIALGHHADVTVRNCRFTDNETTSSGGAIAVDAIWSERLVVRNCVFMSNRSKYGGAIATRADATLDECTFIANHAEKGGGVYVGSYTITRCLFVDNEASDNAGAIMVTPEFARGSVTSCTMYNNLAPDATIVVDPEAGTSSFERNIFFGSNAAGLILQNNFSDYACNLFSNNAGASIVGGSLGPTDLEADPLFCNPAEQDFTLANASPAAPAHSLCGEQIGAFPVGCNDVPVLFTTFHAVAMVGRIRLDWEISTDEAVEGFRIARRGGPGDSFTWLPTEGMIEASARHFADASVIPAFEYEYTLYAYGETGEFASIPIRARAHTAPNSLAQNFPNPFNPTTRIDYSISADGPVDLRIYDVGGALVRSVVAQSKRAGAHSTYWDGRDDHGAAAASGVYFYQLRAGSFSATKKMILLR